MKQIKFRVIVEDKSSDEGTDIIVEDGGVATFRHNGEEYLTEYYQSRITDNTDPNNVWDDLAEGKMHYKEWGKDEPKMDEVIKDALSWLYCSTGEIEFIQDDTIWTNIFKDK